MNNSYEAPMTDVELMALAKKRVKLKKAFKKHLFTYIAVNTFLVCIYFVTSRGYFWPIWPMLGWGLGLTINGIAVFTGLSYEKKSDDVLNEYNRLKSMAQTGSGYNHNKQDQNSQEN